MLPGSYRLLDLNGDGRINSSDRVPVFGQPVPNPPIQYGLTLAASYKILISICCFKELPVTPSDMPMMMFGGYGGKTNKSYLIAKYVDRWHPVKYNR